MRKGTLIGAIIGFVIGLLLQSTGSFTTGMTAQTISIESFPFFAATIWVTVFIAALCGVIGAFLGAVLEEVFGRK